MVVTKSLDKQFMLITTLLVDFNKSHGNVFNTKSLRLTTQVVQRRILAEGIGFLTKTLPRLGKALDRALSSNTPLNADKLAFASQPNSELPKLLGEFFNRVFYPDGTVLPDPCARSVECIRLFCYLYYKYELPYTTEQEAKVLDRFKQTEQELITTSADLSTLSGVVRQSYSNRRRRRETYTRPEVAREARILLSRVFSGLDLKDIHPSHGPGAVATRQVLWEKYEWTNVSHRLTDIYPLDAFFYASVGHVCDQFRDDKITDLDSPARVILVPKDSRGPRLISAEPVDFQWIQQGLMRRIVTHVETLDLTRFNVFYTDQGPNGRGALLGSKDGRYVTLDLNEASDRVSLELVRLLFPEHVVSVLEATRTLSTIMPSGEEVKLLKYAPMGSALCFPILALTVWSILSAGISDANTRESILVYGDDVVVPSAYADEAIARLESFGLKVNRDKSCTSGLFRESCGVDAFRGHLVTPVRLRTVWQHHPDPNTYVSWIAYANQFYDRGYHACYDHIVAMLHHVYGGIPDNSMFPKGSEPCPCLREVPECMRPKRVRTNQGLQKRQWKVRCVKSPSVQYNMCGWSMLLRFFTEGNSSTHSKTSDDLKRSRFLNAHINHNDGCKLAIETRLCRPAFSVRMYTKRQHSILCWRWC